MRALSLLTALLMTTFASAQNIAELKDKAEAGDVESITELGIGYILGEGVSQDTYKGMSLLKKSAALGESWAQYTLGIIYRDGKLVEQDYQKAFGYFQTASVSEEKALIALGELYEWGKGVDKDKTKALETYAQARERGYKMGCVKMADLYRIGFNGERDLEKAFGLISEAAADSMPEAVIKAAHYHFYGWGTPRDSARAAETLLSLLGTQWSDKALEELRELKETGLQEEYPFQFMMLPSVFALYVDGYLDDETMTDMQAIRLFTEEFYFIQGYDYDWGRIMASCVHPEEGVSMLLYELPEPSRMPLCKYIAGVVDRASGKSGYFTLEKTISLSEDDGDEGNHYMLCGVDKAKTHLNFGEYEGKVSPEGFTRAVMRIFKHMKEEKE